MAIKWDIHKIADFFMEHGCILQSSFYKNEDTYLTYTCKCGIVDTKKFSAFKRSPHCRECYKENMSKKMALSLVEVEKHFKDQGCILLSKSYKNAWQYLDYICICGNKSKIQYANFVKGVRCKGCPSKRKYTEQNLKVIIENFNGKYISQTGIDIDDRVRFICHCGNDSDKSIRSLVETKRCNKCSHESFIDKVSGENNSNWNYELTNEQREENRDFPEYQQWRRSVFERDNYTCQCCKKKGITLNAHHKDGYHWCVERRLDVDNGITLCDDCHKDFHRVYGVRNNTEIEITNYLTSKTSEI